MSTTPQEDLGSILGHFGPYGGRFVPEARIGALDDAVFQLDDADAVVRADGLHLGCATQSIGGRVRP